MKLDNKYDKEIEKLQQMQKEFSEKNKNFAVKDSRLQELKNKLDTEMAVKTKIKKILSSNKHIFHANVRIILEALIEKVFLGESLLTNSEKIFYIFNDLYDVIKENKNSDLIDQKVIDNLPQSVMKYFDSAEEEGISNLFKLYSETNKNLHLNKERNYDVLSFPKYFEGEIRMINDILKIYNKGFKLDFFSIDD